MPQQVPFEVYAYSIGELERLVCEKSESTREIVSAKLHRHYFEGYFSSIAARTIVVENDYVDRDFLEDYAAYYVRCFSDYRRKCARLHFFENTFDHQDLEKLLAKSKGRTTLDELRSKYLGFIVIKPIPQTVVGRTCLKTYPPAGRRHFPITRKYDVSLFGVPLEVDTLAYQEQDKVVAACATSALWSVFHGTGKLFQHSIPSPVEITKLATEYLAIETRILPNHGLTAAMMAHAIRGVGLEPFHIKVDIEYVLKSTLYAYLRGRIPMILGIDLYDTASTPNEWMGKHAVAVTGYSVGSEQSEAYSGFHLRALRLDKIYVHDDQVGPFARMVLDGAKIITRSNGHDIEISSLTTSWRGSNDTVGSARAAPEILLVPLYHKIRIPFEVVHDTVFYFDQFLKALADHFDLPYCQRLEWDIYLTTVNDLKKEVFTCSMLEGEALKRILVGSMPRYLWRATASDGGSGAPRLDLIFDATDIEQGSYFVRAIEYDVLLSTVLRAISKEPALEAKLKTSPHWKIVSWFRDQPTVG